MNTTQSSLGEVVRRTKEELSAVVLQSDDPRQAWKEKEALLCSITTELTVVIVSAEQIAESKVAFEALIDTAVVRISLLSV